MALFELFERQLLVLLLFESAIVHGHEKFFSFSGSLFTSVDLAPQEVNGTLVRAFQEKSFRSLSELARSEIALSSVDTAVTEGLSVRLVFKLALEH